MKFAHIRLVLVGLLTLSLNHQQAIAQFSWDGDCGFNWADCCNYGTEQNPEWRNNWTIAPSSAACPNLPGSEDAVYASTTVVLAQPYQTYVKSLSVTGTFMLLSELDIADYLTINGTITEPTTFLIQNGLGVELHSENATASISSFATLEFQSDLGISGGPGAMLSNDGLIWKSLGGKNPPPYESLSALHIPWENNGTIKATDGKLVFMQGGTNNGIIEAYGDAEIRFQGPADFMLDGEVRGDGLIRFLSTFVGGATTVTGDYHPTNTLIAGGYATVNFAVDTDIENLTLGNPGIIGGAGDLTIDDLLWNGGYSTMAPGGMTIVQDTALIQHDTFAGGGFALNREMELHGDSILEGAQVTIDDGELRNYGDLQMLGNATITQACCTPDAIVRNFDTLRKVSGAPSLINVVTFNFGAISVESGALHFDGEMSNQGSIALDAGTTLGMGHKRQTNHASGTITGEGEVFFYNDFWSGDETVDSMLGEYDVGATTIQAGTVSFDDDGDAATQHTTGTLNLIQGFGGTKLQGDADLVVTDQLNWSSGEMAGTGTTFVHGPMILTFVGYWQSLSRTLELNADTPLGPQPPSSTLAINPQGTLRCKTVIVDGHVNNSGAISPGTPMAPIAQLHLTGGYTQTAGGQLTINKLGPAHDQLLVDGLATLGGTLNASGFPASGGQSFTILTAADVQGAFAMVNVPSGVTVTYTATSVILHSAPGTPCPADIDSSGAVDVDDLIGVILGWGGCANCTSCEADTNNDCGVDVDDLIAVILGWGACP